MTAEVLSTDATIGDILPTLKDPEEYVRRALENMQFYEKEHGSARLRIGVMGRGYVPHYRLEPISTSDEMERDFLEGDEAYARYFVAFDGRSHKRHPWSELELKTRNWSHQAMAIDEIRDLLGTIRKARRQR